MGCEQRDGCYKAEGGTGLPWLLCSSLGRRSRCCEIRGEVALEALLISECRRLPENLSGRKDN